MQTIRKPRLALMGEFSAGKSTLTNLLLGATPLPTRVTATRLPPVWITYGDGPVERVDLDGVAHPVSSGTLSGISPDNTRLIRLQLQAEALELCDLIDLPGISDPNMPPDLWRLVMDDVDQVVWCTHATQAWRQSEAAAWEDVMGRTNGRNLLLVTQIDKLTSARDRERVMARLRRETEGMFEGQYAVSLTEALAAGEDADKWAASGAAEFTEHLVDLLLAPPKAKPARTAPREAPAPVAEQRPAEQRPAEQRAAEPRTATPEAVAANRSAAVLPKRVRIRTQQRLRTRPVTPEMDMLLAEGGQRQ